MAIFNSLLQFQSKNKLQTYIWTNKEKIKKVLVIFITDLLKSAYFTLFRNIDHNAEEIQARLMY